MSKIERYFYSIYYGPYNIQKNAIKHVYITELLRVCNKALEFIHYDQAKIDYEDICNLLFDIECITDAYCLGGQYIPVKALIDPWTLNFILRSKTNRKWTISNLNEENSGKYVSDILIQYFKYFQSPGKKNSLKLILSKD